MLEKKRISAGIEKSLNEQMTREAHAAEVYLALASWAENQGFAGVADFMYRHAAEERNHMMKFLKYINSRQGYCRINQIPAVLPEPKDLKDLFEKAIQHEFDNSAAINKLVSQAMREEDWATWNFLQWFVKEQIEEETLVLALFDKYELASTDKKNNVNLYEFDRDLSGAPQDVSLPQDSTQTNP